MNSLKSARVPPQFSELVNFLCKKYQVDRNIVFVEYSSAPPPLLKGGRAGYYDGLLSFRENSGHLEFLITVFRASRNPLLTLAHEFAHLVNNLKSGGYDKQLGPPNEDVERTFDNQAMKDLAEFNESTTTTNP